MKIDQNGRGSIGLRTLMIQNVLIFLLALLTSGCDESPIQLTDAEIRINSIQYDEAWTGTIYVPWMGGDVRAYVDADDSGIQDIQYDSIRCVARLPMRTLTDAQDYLLEQYQRDIYGSIAATTVNGEEIDFEELTPPVKSKEELWGLLTDIHLIFPSADRIDDDFYFQIAAECPWDEEHGLAITFDLTGRPVDVGGQ